MCTKTSVVAVAATLFFGVTLSGQSSIRGWGYGFFDTESRSGPAAFVSADSFNTVVIRADGRLFIQGGNTAKICERPAPPPGLHYVSAHVGEGCAIGRLSDGSLVGWISPYSNWPPWTIPPLPAGATYTKYAVGVDHALLLRSDGIIVTIGTNNYGQRNVPTFPLGLSVVDVFAGTAYSGALLSDGSLWCWGSNGSGECNVPLLPPGLTYTAVSLGKNQTLTNQTLALRSDGSMVAFGTYLAGINTVPPLPNGVTWVKCAAGGFHNVGLRSDGVVEVWGDNFYNQLDMPALPTVPIVDIDAGFLHTVVRLADGRVVTWGGITKFNSDLPVLPGGRPPTAPRRDHLAASRSRRRCSLASW